MGKCPNMKKHFYSNFETKKSFSVSEKHFDDDLAYDWMSGLIG